MRDMLPRTCDGAEERRPAAAADISAPRGKPPGNITAYERRGRGSAVRRRGRRRGKAAANVAPRGRPRRCVAADERRGGGVAATAAAGRPRRSAPCGGDVAAVAVGWPWDGISAPRGWPQGCVATDERRGGEGEWSHGDARSTVWDLATTRARSSGRGRYRLSSAGMHSASTPCLRELPWGPKGGVWRCESAQGAATADEAPTGRGQRHRPSSNGRRP